MTQRLSTLKNHPVAARNGVTQSAHGHHWVDWYAWLRPPNWKEVLKNPDTLPAPIADYLNAENNYHDEVMANLAPLQDEIATELRGRMPEKVKSIPFEDGPYRYLERIEEGAKYPICSRTDLNGENEEIYFDVNAVATGFDYFDVGQITHSPDHNKLLWSCDTNGSEFYKLHIRDIATGIEKNYVLENICDAVWADCQTIFYTRLNDTGRSNQVYKHILDSDPDGDVLIYTESDERFSCDVHRSFSRRYIYIQSGSFDQDEWWYIPIDEVNTAPVLVQQRVEGLEYVVQDQGDSFVILTNADHAIDWKLVKTSIHKPSKENWADLVPHKPGSMVSDYIVYRDWIVWIEKINALAQVAYMDKNGTIRKVVFDEEAYAIGIDNHFAYASSSVMLEYASPTTPWEIYEFRFPNEEKEVLKKQRIPSGHSPKDYVTQRFFIESHDGSQVPVTLLYRHDTTLDGTAPALLYGYGCYGSSSIAGFDSNRLSLVDRGFVYAIAHVRGGSEKGGAWHEDAKCEKKVNSFHDFVAVASGLIEQKICASGKIVALGESAGGLLVTASMNMKPELFAGIIADVPDVDVLNLMLDSSLPGVPVHWSEWGNPLEDKLVFDSIRSYSPYENTCARAYPALYVTAGISDTRVFFWQPAKWVASLRAVKTDDNVILLKTNMQSGHFGNTGRYAHVEELARQYSFAIAVTAE